MLDPVIMLDTSKWILDADNDELVHEVAIRTLQTRMAAVKHFLPLAAERPEEDIEYVHQLRVATRRAVAALMVYQEWFGGKARKKLGRELKRIRRAAGNARDYDVLIQRHSRNTKGRRSQAFVESVRRKRGEAQQPLCAASDDDAQRTSLERLTARLFASVRTKPRRGKSRRFGKWAPKRLQVSIDAFFAAEPEEIDDLASIHEFRICGKELRYAMELLAAAFPEAFRNKLYIMVEHLQDRLGEINDHAVALDRFRKWREEAQDAAQRKYLGRLMKKEEKELGDALWRFARWWTPRRSKQIQHSFRKLVGGKQEKNS